MGIHRVYKLSSSLSLPISLSICLFFSLTQCFSSFQQLSYIYFFYLAIWLIYAACINMNNENGKWHRMDEVLLCIILVCVCVRYRVVFFSSSHSLSQSLFRFSFFFLFTLPLWQAYLFIFWPKEDMEKIGCGYLHTTNNVWIC